MANARNVKAPCAWSAKHYKEVHYCNDNSRDKMLHSTTVLVYYIFDDYWTCGVLVKFTKNILEGSMPPYLPLNTALSNHMADASSATTPRAWSVGLYDLSRNAYRNNDLRGKMLHPTTVYYAMFWSDCKAWTVIVQTYINILGGLNLLTPPLNTALCVRIYD